MPPDVDFNVGFCGKGAVLLGAGFRDTDVGQASCRARDTWLWLAQKANHPPFTKQLDGLTIMVERGQWFGTLETLRLDLGMAKGTLRLVLKELEVVIGAISSESIERPQRYKKRPVNGSKIDPFKGSKIDHQGVGNRPDVRCLGTLVKVHGWKEIASQTSKGSKIDPLNISTATTAPRLTPRLRAEKEAALQALEREQQCSRSTSVKA